MAVCRSIFLLEVVLMSLLVMKFGGSSVRDAEHLVRMAQLVRERRAAGHDVVAVLSAQGDTTDELLKRAAEAAPAPQPRELDALLSAGEQMSAALGAMALRAQGVDAVSLCGWQIPLRTDGMHTNAEVTDVGTERIRRELDAGRAVIAAGFQGVDGAGDITTLGRGGSDTSAVAIAAALHAGELVICTDVDGIYSADPRLCPDAVRRARIGYRDMLLLASRGAQVLHDRSVALAARCGVEIRVCACGSVSGGSVVCAEGEDIPVVGITQKKSADSALAAITAVGGALPSAALERTAIKALEQGGVGVHAVSAGERYLSLFVPCEDAGRALRLAHGALIG